MRKELGIAVLLVVLCVVVASLNPRFLSATNLQNMARLVGIYGIFSIGLGLVIITGGIDLSVGSVLGLAGIVAGLLLNQGQPAAVAVAAALAVGLLAGATNGFFVTRVAMPPFVPTLGMLSLARGLAFVLTEGRSISDFGPATERFRALGAGEPLSAPLERRVHALRPLLSLVSVETVEQTPKGPVRLRARNPVPVKAMMNILGMPSGPCRPPLGRLTRPALDIVLDALGTAYLDCPDLFDENEATFDVSVDERLRDRHRWESLAYAA